MISFDKPENLDGAVLLQELEAAGVKVGVDYRGRTNPPALDGDNKLWIDIESKDKNKAEAVLAAHSGSI